MSQFCEGCKERQDKIDELTKECGRLRKTLIKAQERIDELEEEYCI